MKAKRIRKDFDIALKQGQKQSEVIKDLITKYKTTRPTVRKYVILSPYYTTAKSKYEPYKKQMVEIIGSCEFKDEAYAKIEDILPFSVGYSAVKQYCENNLDVEKRNKGRWRKDFDKIIINEISECPENIKKAFIVAQGKINMISKKKYSRGYIAFRWYTVLSFKHNVFKIVSKKKVLHNIKNHTPHSKLGGCRKVKVDETR